MGCVGSKLEPEAVALCRGRSDLLAETIRHRYALADAHAAHADSLRSVAAAVHRLLSSGHEAHLQESPILPLPSLRKGDPHSPSCPPPPLLAAAATPLPYSHSHSHSHSRSQSGSHIHFHSSNDSDSDIDSAIHSDDDSPVHLHLNHHEVLSGPSYFKIHYTRNSPPPSHSLSFGRLVGSPEQVHYASVAEPSSSSSYPYGYQCPGESAVPSDHPFPYTYQPSHYGYSGMAGFYSSSSPYPSMSQYLQGGHGVNFKASTSRAAPPSPSPPKTSTWEFLNPFESFENYYPPYTPSRSSKEATYDEGIPALEEDDQEVIKEAYEDQRFVASTSATAAPEYFSKDALFAKDAGGSPMECSQYHLGSKEDDKDVVEKNVVGSVVHKTHEERRNAVAPCSYHDVSEIANDIRFHLERAAESTKELAIMLEVGKQPYNRKNSVYSVSSRMMRAIPVSISKDEDLDYVEEKILCTGNLSSTLQKLYIWEQKLYDEVRVVEKMRVLHDRSTKKLQHLDKGGAEAQKIEVTQTLIRKLSTKIRIGIQVINSVSAKISLLRDEELWPQIDEIIQGLERMWKAMLECHQIQSHALSEDKYLDSIASGRRLSHEHMNALIQLELELLRWIGNFSSWINSQKNFVKSLNSWLLLCLPHEPEVTADGIPPYFPVRIGVPPVFAIFNNWSQALDRVSMKEILDALQSSAASLKQLGQENDSELHQKRISIREVERLNRHLLLSSENNDLPLSQSQHTEPIRLQCALKLVFQAMENFANSSMNVYKDLNARAVEEKAKVDSSGSQV